MRTLHFVIFGALLVSGLASCSQQTVDPSGDASATFTANQTDIKNYAASKGLSGTTTASGLYFALTQPS